MSEAAAAKGAEVEEEIRLRAEEEDLAIAPDTPMEAAPTPDLGAHASDEEGDTDDEKTPSAAVTQKQSSAPTTTAVQGADAATADGGTAAAGKSPATREVDVMEVDDDDHDGDVEMTTHDDDVGEDDSNAVDEVGFWF
jgi:hypothetical protein